MKIEELLPKDWLHKFEVECPHDWEESAYRPWLMRRAALEAARAAFEMAADECRSYDDCQVILEMTKELE